MVKRGSCLVTICSCFKAPLKLAFLSDPSIPIPDATRDLEASIHSKPHFVNTLFLPFFVLQPDTQHITHSLLSFVASILFVFRFDEMCKPSSRPVSCYHPGSEI